MDAPADRLKRELSRLTKALGARARVSSVAAGEGRETVLEPVDGALPVTVVEAGGRVTVALAGWRREFALAADDREDAEDACDLALDLVGAALFGELRIVEHRRDGVARRWEVAVRRGGAWQTIDHAGAGSWNPFVRRERVILANALPRPRGYKAVDVTRPDAPWAGRAGFCGGAQTEAPGELQVDGVLDLHNFHPRELGKLIPAYLEACRARGIVELRIIHGKGIGNVRRSVHALLDRSPAVAGYRLAGHGAGSWGATIVDLKPGP
ncbi:MAG: Smr/MutS family protein [Nannocystaceae bacterium]